VDFISEQYCECIVTDWKCVTCQVRQLLCCELNRCLHAGYRHCLWYCYCISVCISVISLPFFNTVG